MTKKIYVGNLPYNASEQDIQSLFQTYGTVHSVKLITDRETGRKKGFGFVEMDGETADTAIEALNNQDFGGRSIKVSEAREREMNGGGREYRPRGDRNDRRPRQY